MARIHDSVHGLIRFTGVLEKIIQTEEFQRLNDIKVTGMAYKAFPDAKESRKSHSQGSCEEIRKALKHLQVPSKHSSKKLLPVRIPKEDQRLLETGMLLHDIGHTAFSHAPEPLSKRNHEELGFDIIRGKIQLPNRESGKIAAILREYDIDPEDIITLIKGDKESLAKRNFPQYYHTLISGDVVDCDKMDYLRRNTYFSGASIGTIDVSRLRETLLINTDASGGSALGVHHGGVVAVRQLIVARNNMFSQVYFNHITLVAETMLVRAIRDSLPNMADVEYPLLFDDSEMMERLHRDGTPLTKDLVRRLKGGSNRLYAEAYTAYNSDLRIDPSTDPRTLEENLLAETGLQPGDILIAKPRWKEKETVPYFPVLLGTGTWKNLFGSNVDGIATAAIKQRTTDIVLAIYAKPEYREKVAAAAQHLLEVKV